MCPHGRTEPDEDASSASLSYSSESGASLETKPLSTPAAARLAARLADTSISSIIRAN